MRYYKQLSLKERQQIRAFLDMNYTTEYIASRLKRHRSTIYREINRNIDHEDYYPHKAQAKAYHRKQRKPFKLVVNSLCYKYVMDKLKIGWSPEQISGRMQRLQLPYKVCHETIYQYIYKHARSHIYYYLPMQKYQRKPHRKRKTRLLFRGNRCINNRPIVVETRKTLGHWEGDTIRFANERKQSITTLVERKSRFVVLQKNCRSTSHIVMNNIKNVITQLSNKLWQTITFDQGSEFADFSMIERYSKCKVFYAHARSPWLRGSNENTNKRLRRYLPKHANVKNICQKQLEWLENKFNTTPRKCLGYLTPREVLLGVNMKNVALDYGI